MCSVSVQKGSKWKDTVIILNTEAEVNVISQCFTMKLELKFIKNVKLSQPEWINKQTVFCYSIYQVTIWAMNVWGWEKNNTYTFYSLNKTGVPFILNMLYFWAEGIMIDCVTSLWCWDVEAPKHEILKPKKFEKILRNEPVVYVLILGNKNENVTALIIF